MKSKSKTNPGKYAKPFVDAAGATLAPTYEAQNAAQKQFEPGIAQARGLLTNTIDGQYLDGNPHTEAYINHAEDDATDRVNSQFGSRFGSGYHATALARELANIRNAVQFNQYNTERARQGEAVGQLGQLAGQATALPGIASGQYADATRGLFGAYNTTTQKQGAGGLLAGIAGAGLSGWAGGGFKGV